MRRYPRHRALAQQKQITRHRTHLNQIIGPGLGWDDGLDLRSCKPLSQTVRVVDLVDDQPFGRASHFQQRDCHPDVGDVGKCQGEGDRSAAIIGQTMDFACSSAMRRANRLRRRPPFEPWAERCA